MPSRCVLIVLDGLGDRSYASLGGLTPLQAARTPNLDRLASLGANGLFHAGAPGQALPSEHAHFIMFGYREHSFPGRGYLEAVGAGIKLSPKDVAILAHFVSVREEKGILILEKDRPAASADEIRPLVELVESYESRGLKVSYIQTRNLDGILVLRGEVSRFITDTDPLQEGRPLIEPEPWSRMSEDPPSRKTAETLREYLLWCYGNLTNHEVNAVRKEAGKPRLNAIATNRAGSFEKAVPFSELWGLRGLSISAGIVYHGLCKHVGMDVEKVSDSGDSGGDLAARIELAMSRLDDYDFVHVHTKGPDAVSHRKDEAGKKKVIEELDRGLGELVDRILENRDIVLVIASDHSTPCTYPLVHSGEPVPVTIVGEGVRRDAVERYDEVHCAAGALGLLRGGDLMQTILNCLDRVKLLGLMDTPQDQAYWPGNTKPFTL